MSGTPGAIRTALDAVLLWLGFFAGWTLASIPLTLTCRPFEWLWVAFGAGIVGASLSLTTLRTTLGPVLLSPAELPWQVNVPRGRRAWLWGAGLVVLTLAALVFVATSNALPLWFATVVLALAALLEPDEPAPRKPAEPSRPAAAWARLLLLILGIVVLYILILRPDADDAFYLNLPIGLVSGEICMMAADTMYGAVDWPLLGSNYRVETLPTLNAALSWLTGLPAITVAHLLLPVIWCVIWACTLAVIGYGLFGKHWFVFALLAVLASMAFSGNLQTWGVHGVARLFHGKAPLIVILIPLMVYLVARGSAARRAYTSTFAALFGLCAVSVGLTANAIYLAPLVLLMAVVAAQVAWPGDGRRRLVLLAAAATPIAAGLWLLLFDIPVSAGPADATRISTTLAFWNMASHKLTLGLLVATMAVAAVAGKVGAGGRWVSAYLAVFLIIGINPVLWPVYDRFVTGGLSFRLWWALPLPTFLAIALTWALFRSGWPRMGGALAGAGLAVMALLPSGLIGMEETSLRPSIHKIPSDTASVVQEVLSAASEEGTVLAPEEIAAWLSVWEGHPDLVYSRTLYLEQSAPVVAPERLAPRKLLAEWIANASDVPAEDLLVAMRLLDVRLIVLPAQGSPANADTLLSEIGATDREVASGYVLWSLPADSH